MWTLEVRALSGRHLTGEQVTTSRLQVSYRASDFDHVRLRAEEHPITRTSELDYRARVRLTNRAVPLAVRIGVMRVYKRLSQHCGANCLQQESWPGLTIASGPAVHWRYEQFLTRTAPPGRPGHSALTLADAGSGNASGRRLPSVTRLRHPVAHSVHSEQKSVSHDSVHENEILIDINFEIMPLNCEPPYGIEP